MLRVWDTRYVHVPIVLQLFAVTLTWGRTSYLFIKADAALSTDSFNDFGTLETELMLPYTVHDAY